ncbi:hypothetical protein L1I79_37230 [Strepomyces sp. STD 3.1]|nr:hypothetical protein [Streptomyces sp. STD 3.1]
MGVRSGSAYSEFLLLDQRNINPGVNVPWTFTGTTDGSFALDTVTRTFTANRPGVFLVLYNLFIQGGGQGSVYSIRVNGIEQTNSIFGFQQLANNDSRLSGQSLLNINAGDVVGLGNTGNTADILLASVDGQLAVAAASIIFVKIARQP